VTGVCRACAARYWSSFARDDGEPVMALDLADLARPWANGAFSVLGHSREELRLGSEGDVIVAAAELEAVIMGTSSDVIDCVVVGVPDMTKPSKPWRKPDSIPLACLVLPEQATALTEARHAPGANARSRKPPPLSRCCKPRLPRPPHRALSARASLLHAGVDERAQEGGTRVARPADRA
jgi:hypothetical protein